jgi:hypothetical protein
MFLKSNIGFLATGMNGGRKEVLCEKMRDVRREVGRWIYIGWLND